MFGQSSSRENSSQSSIARSGSSSRIWRGVSSCSAAVSTLIFMNLGSNERGDMASPFFSGRACNLEQDHTAGVDAQPHATARLQFGTARHHDKHAFAGPIDQKR